MTSEHTPTPWHFCPEEYSGLDIVRSNGSRTIPAAAITGRSPTDGGEGWHYIAAMNSHTESAADAEFIVRACNAHDDLLSVAVMLDQFDALASSGAEREELLQQTIRAARAALKKMAV